MASLNKRTIHAGGVAPGETTNPIIMLLGSQQPSVIPPLTTEDFLEPLNVFNSGRINLHVSGNDSILYWNDAGTKRYFGATSDLVDVQSGNTFVANNLPAGFPHTLTDGGDRGFFRLRQGYWRFSGEAASSNPIYRTVIRLFKVNDEGEELIAQSAPSISFETDEPGAISWATHFTIPQSSPVMIDSSDWIYAAMPAPTIARPLIAQYLMCEYLGS